MLPEVAIEEAAEGEVFIEVGPVEAERGKLDAVELGRRAAHKARVLCDGETDFHAAGHLDHDEAVPMEGAAGGVSQGVHAIFE